MKVNHIRILTEVLDPGTTNICRIGGRFVLIHDDVDSMPERVAEHEDWTKFLWLCGEWYKSR